MNPVALSNVRVPGRVPITSPIVCGEPAKVPLLENPRIWSDAAWVTNGPGLKLKSSEPAVPEMEEVLTITS